MDPIPFAPEDQLCHKLHITPDQTSIQRLPRSAQSAYAPARTPQRKSHLPGQPRIALEYANIGAYLDSELVTRDLDKLATHLWLIAKQDSSHISSLTHQVVRGRGITITEKPELHLVWIHNRVFIKPIPLYLLSYAFWGFYLSGRHSPIPQPKREEITRAALGFLRSYSYLIQHKSDFLLATDDNHRLIPKHISHCDFTTFIMSFDKVEDISVAPRYNFGELRLARLNSWSKIFLRRFSYHKVYDQYRAHFAQFYAPLLFVFAVLSVALSAMQVALAFPAFPESGQSWLTFAQVSRGFSICTIIGVALVVLLLTFTLFAMLFREISFALKDLYRKRKSRSQETVDGRLSASKSLA
jgi:hypothetical protein